MSIQDSPRGAKAYIWVTWVTSLLAGTDQCVWKAWYKSHFRYAKRVEEGVEPFDLQAWTEQHNRMTDARVEELKKTWPKVQVEEANAFKLVGQSATLSGKPDIVALDRDKGEALIVDEKSGRERESDVWQVLLYMFALPLTWLKDTTIKHIDGEVEYRGSRRAVPAGLFTEAAKRNIVSTLRVVGGNDEPQRSPSAQECRYCDILNCPERFNEPKNSTGDASKYF